jgi:5-oxoprolinase (ATP-hydrolysing)
VVVHRYCGILSAYGMGLADVVEEAQEPYAAVYGPLVMDEVSKRSAALKEEVKKQLGLQVFFAQLFSPRFSEFSRFTRAVCFYS